MKVSRRMQAARLIGVRIALDICCRNSGETASIQGPNREAVSCIWDVALEEPRFESQCAGVGMNRAHVANGSESLG